MVLGASVTVVGLLPMFLAGAMAVQLTDGLGFGAVGLGWAVGMFHATGALTSVPLGRLTDRLGAIWSIRLAAVISAVASIGIATTAKDWLTFTGWLVLASGATTLAQPAANRLLINAVPSHRYGIAFGVKQSAPPVASMLGGLSVPLIAATAGWQWAYGLAALLALAVFVGAGRRPPRSARGAQPSRAARRHGERSVILLLAVSVGLSAAASATVFTFFVDASVRAGGSEQVAGGVLAAASLAAVATRLICGAAADRMRGGHLQLCAGLIAVGTGGIALLMSSSPLIMGAGAVIALAGTWGMNGLFWYAVVGAFSDAPGTITGAVGPGLLLGGSIGPIVFGMVAGPYGYPVAWALSCAWSAIAAAVILRAAGRLSRHVTPQGL